MQVRAETDPGFIISVMDDLTKEFFHCLCIAPAYLQMFPSHVITKFGILNLLTLE